MTENDKIGMGDRQDDSVTIDPLSLPDGESSAEGAASGLGSTVGSKFVGAGAAFASSIANGGKGIGRAMTKAGSAVGTKIMAAGTGVSGLTGGLISPMAGAAASGGGLVLSAVMAGSLLTGIATDAAQREGEILKCFENGVDNAAERANASGGVDGAEGSKIQEETAKKVYSILSYAGMGDVNISGILGNWSVESGIDATSVETIMSEKYTIGPRKKQAEADDFKIEKIDAGYAARFPTINRAGIGLGQWTDVHPGDGGRNTMLRDFADGHKVPWYEVETQLAFMMSDDDPMRVAVVDGMIDKEMGSPEEATMHFLTRWEGINDGTGGTRSEAAGNWYAKMGGWDTDTDLGKSVLAMANTTKKSANNRAAQEELNDCIEKAGGSLGGGNADAAEAMATYSWAYLDWGNGNNGTELYQYLMGEIFPGDPYYMSCDRGVATAVRWSGTDDTFPVGPTSAQYQYFMGEGREKWEQVDGIDQESNMKAGDVLVTKGDGHIQMYLGEEVVKDVWGDTPHEPNATMASASFGERSPGLQNWEGYSTDNRPYSGWRSKGPEKNSKYKDIKVPSNIKDGPQSKK